MKGNSLLHAFAIENFKAIQKSGSVRLSPLTVLIGNNGSGKSSLIEGMETYRSIVIDGLDAAMSRWLGMDHAWNKRSRESRYGSRPIQFAMRGRTSLGRFEASLAVNASPGGNGIFVEHERGKSPERVSFMRDREWAFHDFGYDRKTRVHSKSRVHVSPGESATPEDLKAFMASWQFLSLAPDLMGRPTPKQMTGRVKTLNRDGSNLAQYLLGIREKDTSAFEGIVEAMQFVVESARNFEPVENREIQPTMYLRMLEPTRDGSVDIPGWMISTGTIRILGLLAVLRNPEPPPLIVVEEIENGLDPRTIHLILEEIQGPVESGRSQVIMTTHSPYLLDLLPLSSILLCERDGGGNPTFHRPSDDKEKAAWAKRFSPGQLYTMSRLSGRGGK